jgi:hypothetical protein
MVLEELSREKDRLWALDAEHSGLSVAIDLMCFHLRIPRSGESSAKTSWMTLVASCIRELEAVMFRLEVYHALVAARPLGEDWIE